MTYTYTPDWESTYFHWSDNVGTVGHTIFTINLTLEDMVWIRDNIGFTSWTPTFASNDYEGSAYLPNQWQVDDFANYLEFGFMKFKTDRVYSSRYSFYSESFRPDDPRWVHLLACLRFSGATIKKGEKAQWTKT